MEVAIGNNNSNAPFQREVREWQRVDPNTGALLTGRLEADRWINGPLNTYGKVVDSQNLSTPNGTQHTQRKQLEVLQARTSSGSSLQVVRAHTVHTSSSRWSSSSSSSPAGHTITSASSDGLTGLRMIQQLQQNSNHQLPSHNFSSSQSLMRSSPQSSSPSLSSPRTEHKTFSKQAPPQSFQAYLAQERNSSNSDKDSNRSHRGKSISTEDLAFDDDLEGCEWKRVSKIRRSLQFPKSSAPKPICTRPPDLPENSVSVSKMREELENGRRLHTAMRNNHVDLAALDNILNGSSQDSDSNKSDSLKSTKKTTFITAESLKEIRGKLKRLSDESLYKDDILQQPDEACSQIGDQQQVELTDQVTSIAIRPKEPRSRARDLISSEWHLRRKSYGFEKMTPPPPAHQSQMSRMETSTDSGIGRSGDLNVSPTDSTPRGTIITFGEEENKTCIMLKSDDSNEPKAYSFLDDPEIKRHSIAVDESKYVRDNLKRVFDTKTSIHLNGLYAKEQNNSTNSFLDENGRRQKRVEFCKTEVHFAAESGRVNIVETDGKPPPTQNFRRRRRSSGNSYIDAITQSGAPLTHFGDEKKSDIVEIPRDEATPKDHQVTVTLSAQAAARQLAREEEENSDELSLRGILKNKPMKPRPYHLGENIDSSQSLWGVRLKPVPSDINFWRSNEKESDGDQIYEHEHEDDVKENKNTGDRIARGTDETLNPINITNEETSAGQYQTKVCVSLGPSWDAGSDHQSVSLSSRLSRHTVEENHIVTESQVRPSKLSPLGEYKEDTLKSTSLIMKTLRSANQFDETINALKALSVSRPIQLSSNRKASTLDHTYVSAFKLINNMNELTKSNSASNLLDSEAVKQSKPKYSSSLDGILNEECANYQFEEIQKHEASAFNGQIEEAEIVRKPVAAPRMKKLSPSNLISQQLSQLRRLYEAAEQDDSDSDSAKAADDEVNLYLGGLADISNPPKLTEELKSDENLQSFPSGSWSRVKAKRTNARYNANEKEISMQTVDKQMTKANTEIKKLQQTGIKTTSSFNTNVMSIALHSPTSSTSSASTAFNKTATSKLMTTTQQHQTQKPAAKPRTVTPVKTSAQSAVSDQTATPPAARKFNTPSSDSRAKLEAALKLSSGTRKLRDHELSYFGVNLSNSSSSAKITSTQKHIANSVTTINAMPSLMPSVATKSRSLDSKWKMMESDKPDLLKHSPAADKRNVSHEYVPMASLGADKTTMQDDGPIYENLRKPSAYQRCSDFDRDERILNELSQAADQILSAVTGYTDEDSDDRRSKIRSKTNQKINQKPLDTIVENRSTHKAMHSKAVQVSRGYGENLKRTTKPSRVSSASSTESICKPSVRQSQSIRVPSSASSRDEQRSARRRASSLRSETSNTRLSRTSSRDTLQSQASSSEDLNVETPRRPRRIRTKDKEKDRKETVRSSIHKTDSKSSTTISPTKSSSERTRRTRTSELTNGSAGGTTSSSKSKSSDRHQSSPHHHVHQTQKARIKPTHSSQTTTTTTTTTASKSSHRYNGGIWK